MLAAALLLVAAAQDGEEQLPALRVGETVDGEITDGDAIVETKFLLTERAGSPVLGRSYRVQIEEAGPYHIELRSHFFDTYLVLRDAAGNVLAEDDNGLFATHSRLATSDLEPGGAYTLDACALLGTHGPFELVVRRGAPTFLPHRERARLELADARQQVEALEAAEGSKSLGVATARSRLAQALFRGGSPDEAERELQRCLAIREEVLGREHPDTAETYANMAQLTWFRGDFVTAQSLLERALAINEGVFGPDHLNVAASLNGLANLLYSLGDYAAARPVFERALAIREAALGRDHSDTASTLNNFSALLWRVGDLAAARIMLERVLAIRERDLGPDHPELAAPLNNLGQVLRDQGDSAAALPILERALGIFEETRGSEHPDTAQCLNNLALVIADLGDHETARSFFEHVVRINEARLGPDHPRTALALNNLASSHQSLGEGDTAIRLFERALSIREKTLGPEHPDTAVTLNNISRLYRERGDLAAAQPIHERALAIFEKVLGPEHRDTANTRHNLALLLLDTGNASEALEVLRSGRGRRWRMRRYLLSGLSEGERYLLLARDEWQLGVELAVAKRLNSPSVSLRAYESLLAWKSGSARIVHSSRERLATEMTQEQLELIQELHGAQRRISSLAFASDVRDPDHHVERLRAARNELNQLELALTRSMTGSDDPPSTVSVADLREALPEGAALVDLFLHQEWTAPTGESEAVAPGRWERWAVSAWITRPDRERIVWVHLGSELEIGTAIRSHLQSVARTPGMTQRGFGVPPKLTRSELEAARRILWDPLAEHLEGVDTVFVNPDGILGAVPFETFQLEDGRFAIEDHAFVYLQDASSFLTDPADRSSGGELLRLLAVGAVDFDARDDATGRDGRPLDVSSRSASWTGEWARLHATGPESRAVRDAHADTFGEAGSRLLLLGTAGTEERLKQELPRHQVLHLATHGFFNPDGVPSLWDAARAAVEEERAVVADEERYLVGKLPGLLSGLICAGVNRPEEGRDDGYLTAEEVRWLDLSNVELVVLSACGTGLGREQSGEGLIGLRSAFRTAGAKTVISSLWSVEDESTADLMGDFYKNLWIEKMPRGEALRQAQLAMLNRNRTEHGDPLPATWGAFVLSGEWR